VQILVDGRFGVDSLSPITSNQLPFFLYRALLVRFCAIACTNGSLTLSFRRAVAIPAWWTGQAIGLEVQSGLYNKFDTVLSSSSICQDLTVAATYDQDAGCPDPGDFTLKTYFTVPTIRDYSFHYTPDLKLIFSNADDGTRIGCVATGTAAWHHAAEKKATRGLVALGVAVLMFCSVFGLLLYLSYRRKKRLEQLTAERRKNYQYFRTLPSGQVVSLNGAATAGVSSKTTKRESAMSQGNKNAMNISNPSYNETQTPTRPII
jgi:hypothetical protein